MIRINKLSISDFPCPEFGAPLVPFRSVYSLFMIIAFYGEKIINNGIQGMRFLTIAFTALLAATSWGVRAGSEPAIIPAPMSLQSNEGVYVLQAG